MRWQVKDFVLAGVFGVMTFAVAFLLGAGIILTTGIPATGGIANIFVAVFIVVIGLHLVPRYGFAALSIGILFLVATPTIIGGPPGVYKIANGILIGLVIDTILHLGRRRKAAYILAGSAGAMTSILSIYGAMRLLHLPGVERLQPLVLALTLIQGVTGALGAWLAVEVFHRRLQHLQAVQRLMVKDE